MINVNVCAYSVDISLISGQVIPTTSDTDKAVRAFFVSEVGGNTCKAR